MFGNRLRQLRKAKKYSMDELIDLYNLKYDAKMNKSTLSRYENGLQDPIYTVVVNLAEILNVSVDYLSAGKKCSTPNTFTADEEQLITNYRTLDTIDKAEIRGEIKQMLKADKYTAAKRIKPTEHDYEIAAWGADGTKGTYILPEEEVT